MSLTTFFARSSYPACACLASNAVEVNVLFLYSRRGLAQALDDSSLLGCFYWDAGVLYNTSLHLEVLGDARSEEEQGHEEDRSGQQEEVEKSR